MYTVNMWVFINPARPGGGVPVGGGGVPVGGGGGVPVGGGGVTAGN